MGNYHVTCAGGQCDDPACGIDFVIVAGRKVPAAELISHIEQRTHSYWTVIDGRPLPLVVGSGVDGQQRLQARREQRA